jgi:hypothetical protein
LTDAPRPARNEKEYIAKTEVCQPALLEAVEEDGCGEQEERAAWHFGGAKRRIGGGSCAATRAFAEPALSLFGGVPLRIVDISRVP